MQSPLSAPLNQLASAGPGVYTTIFPKSVGYGNVVSGGIVLAAACKAGSLFTSNRSHVNVVHYAFTFSRPTFSERTTEIHLRVFSAAKLNTVLHVEVQQNGKGCLAGYITLTDLSAKWPVRSDYAYKLLPPPPPVDLAALEADTDPNWSTYVIPIESTNFRFAMTYFTFCLPIKQKSPNSVDMWTRPLWREGEKPALWTNETLHYLIDSSLPPLAFLMEPDPKTGFYNRMVEGGLLQRKQRLAGQKVTETGDRLGDTDFEYIESSLAITTEIKRLLPPEGVKWLFFRTTTKMLWDNRLDLCIDVLDTEGNLVAISQHVALAIQTVRKLEKTKTKSKM